MKYLFLVLLLAACSSNPAQLTDKAKNLEVFTVKPQDCRVVGKVVGVDESGSKDLALNRALNEAATLKATGIFVNQEVPNGNVMKVFATAYQCD